jgi:hypothetical protein
MSREIASRSPAPSELSKEPHDGWRKVGGGDVLGKIIYRWSLGPHWILLYKQGSKKEWNVVYTLLWPSMLPMGLSALEDKLFYKGQAKITIFRH